MIEEESKTESGANLEDSTPTSTEEAKQAPKEDFYNLPGQQISFRVNEAEKALFNDTAKAYQLQKQSKITSPKQLVFNLIEAFNSDSSTLSNEKLEELTEANKQLSEANKQLFEKLTEANAKLTEEASEELTPESAELNELINEAKQLIGYPEDYEVGLISIFKDLIAFSAANLNNKKDNANAEVKEKTPEANQIILDLHPKQKEALEYISNYRFVKKIDEEKMTIDNVILFMTFNRGSLLNYGGHFITGIKAKHLKK